MGVEQRLGRRGKRFLRDVVYQAAVAFALGFEIAVLVGLGDESLHHRLRFGMAVKAVKDLALSGLEFQRERLERGRRLVAGHLVIEIQACSEKTVPAGKIAGQAGNPFRIDQHVGAFAVQETSEEIAGDDRFHLRRIGRPDFQPVKRQLFLHAFDAHERFRSPAHEFQNPLVHAIRQHLRQAVDDFDFFWLC